MAFRFSFSFFSGWKYVNQLQTSCYYEPEKFWFVNFFSCPWFHWLLGDSQWEIECSCTRLSAACLLKRGGCLHGLSDYFQLVQGFGVWLFSLLSLVQCLHGFRWACLIFYFKIYFQLPLFELEILTILSFSLTQLVGKVKKFYLNDSF